MTKETKFYDETWNEVAEDAASMRYVVRLTFEGGELIESEMFVREGPEVTRSTQAPKREVVWRGAR